MFKSRVCLFYIETSHTFTKCTKKKYYRKDLPDGCTTRKVKGGGGRSFCSLHVIFFFNHLVCKIFFLLCMNIFFFLHFPHAGFFFKCICLARFFSAFGLLLLHFSSGASPNAGSAKSDILKPNIHFRTKVILLIKIIRKHYFTYTQIHEK